MTSQKLRASIESAVPVATGFLRVTRYEFEIDKHAGGSHRVVREVMERGHAVAVLAYDPERDVVVLANEFRPGCLVAGDAPFTDNLPAGGIAEGESVIEAAGRELKEETGLELRNPIVVHPGAFVSSGGTSEKIAIVAGIVDASNAEGIYGNPDESEEVRAVVLPALEFIDRVRRAEITDLKTLVAGYWLAENRERLKALCSVDS